MSYIGQHLPPDAFHGFTTDTFTGDGSATTFTLSKAPFSEDSLIVVVDNVIPQPTTNFTVSGTTLTIVGTAILSGITGYAIHTQGKIPVTTATAVDLNGVSDTLILDADADTTISADTDDQIDFKAGGTDRLKIQSTSGNNVVIADGLTLTDGNITFSGSGHGIHLGVTSATAANLLDDYEEGTWTPVVKSNANTITGGTRLATYTKVGRMVHVFFSIAGGTTSGTIDNSGDFFRIQGLPFTSANVTGTRYIGTQFNHYNNPATTEENVLGLVGQNATVIEFVEHDGGGTGYSAARLDSVGSNSYAQFAVVYYVE